MFTPYVMFAVSAILFVLLWIGIVVNDLFIHGRIRNTGILLVLSVLVIFCCIVAENANAGTISVRQNALQSCRSISERTHGYVVCAHHPVRKQVLMSYMTSAVWYTFRDSGKAGALYVQLCLDGGILAVTELVFDREDTRTREIPCGADESPPWVPSNLRLQESSKP